MMKPVPIKLEQIYVPAKLRATLDPARVAALAEAILAEGLQSPIQVRRDGERFVLVTGLHRLEACRSLGEKTIPALIVLPRVH